MRRCEQDDMDKMAWTRQQGHEDKDVKMMMRQMKMRQGLDDEDAKPNTLSFNSVITVWANSFDSPARKQAKAILAQMQRLYEAGVTDVKPNTVSFNAVILAWANSHDSSAGK